MTKASVQEFNNQRNKMPGDREAIAATGPYILELYTDPIGQKPRTVIEINRKQSDGSYEKADSLWFDSEDEAEDKYQELKNSASKVEDSL